MNFNPRSSCEERRAKLHSQFAAGMTFQSTLLMRGATCRLEIDAIFDSISIHAPHARSDTPLRISIWNIRLYFNPRSSCEERHGLACQYPVYFDFNPRSSCEERHHSSIPAHSLSLISIHAPHARSDLGYGTLL